MLHDKQSASVTPPAEQGRHWLQQATRIFLATPKPSTAIKEQYTEIAESTLGLLQVADRLAYAKRVAADTRLPRTVAKTLAADEAIAVAHLVLRLSPVLTDDDLTAIALTQSQGHLIAIAERAALAQITTEVLASRGDLAVLRTLTGNPGADISDTSLAKIAARADGDTMVTANLSQRASQLPERQAQRVLRLAAEAEHGQADRVHQARRQQQQVSLSIKDIQQGFRTLDEVAAKLGRQDRAFDLAIVLAIFAKLPVAHVLKVLLASEVAALRVICASLDLRSSTYEAILTFRGARLKQEPSEILRELACYEEPRDNLEVSLARSLSLRRELIRTISEVGRTP